MSKTTARKIGGSILGTASSALAIVGIWEHSGEWGLTAGVVLLGAIAVMPQESK